MQRQSLAVLGAALVLWPMNALAQDGELASVTMRVLDDVSGIDAVIIELDASPGEGVEGTERGREAGADDEATRDRASDSGDEPPPAP